MAMHAGRRKLFLLGEKALGLDSLAVPKALVGKAEQLPPAQATSAHPASQKTLQAQSKPYAPPIATAQATLPAKSTSALPPATGRNPVTFNATSVQSTGDSTASARRELVEELFADMKSASPPVVRKGSPQALIFTDKPRLESSIKLKMLNELDENQVKTCTRCGLHATRNKTVFGEGDTDARLMFIGEGPGVDEDATGRPFVGRSGQLLEKMIIGMGLSRQQVYIANLVKCRAHNVTPVVRDRPPTPEETEACAPYIMKQIQWIRPEVIVSLGLPATQYLLDSKEAMGRLRGKWHSIGGIPLMPTYHPAYLLRNYTPETRRMVWEDLQQVMGKLGLPVK